MSAAPAPNLPPFAPDADVVDARGATLRLSSLWAARPLLLVFLPAYHSPYFADNAAQLRDAEEILGDAGVSLAAASSATHDETAAFVAENNVDYRLLVDAGGTLRSEFGVAQPLHPETLPASFIIDTVGIVRYEHHGADESDYPPVWDLVAEACRITGAKVQPPPAPLATRMPSLTALRRGAGDATPLPVRTGAWTCGKCTSSQFELNDVSTASGFLSRIFNLQNRRFTAVSCLGCGYSELYRRNSSALMNIVDFLSDS